eukprot:gene10622-2744_t
MDALIRVVDAVVAENVVPVGMAVLYSGIGCDVTSEEVLPPMLMENDSHHICYRNVRGCQLLGDVICPSCLAFAHRHNTLHVRIYGATVGNFDSLPIKLRSRVALILATRDNKHQHELKCLVLAYGHPEPPFKIVRDVALLFECSILATHLIGTKDKGMEMETSLSLCSLNNKQPDVEGEVQLYVIVQGYHDVPDFQQLLLQMLQEISCIFNNSVVKFPEPIRQWFHSQGLNECAWIVVHQVKESISSEQIGVNFSSLLYSVRLLYRRFIPDIVISDDLFQANIAIQDFAALTRSISNLLVALPPDSQDKILSKFHSELKDLSPVVLPTHLQTCLNAALMKNHGGITINQGGFRNEGNERICESPRENNGFRADMPSLDTFWDRCELDVSIDDKESHVDNDDTPTVSAEDEFFDLEISISNQSEG